MMCVRKPDIGKPDIQKPNRLNHVLKMYLKNT